MNNPEVDLHTHSIYSDGTFFPAELMNTAELKGIKILSITDHNCVTTCRDNDNIRIIPGIEISAEQTINNHVIGGVEILGYGFDIKKMKNLIEPVRVSKVDSIKIAIKNFNSLTEEELNKESRLFEIQGKRLTSVKEFFDYQCEREIYEEEYSQLINNSAPTRLDLAKFLSEKFFKYNDKLRHVYGNPSILFKKDFSKTIFKKVELQKLSLFEAIKMVKKSGGVAILAHPGVCSVFIKNEFEESKTIFNGVLDSLKHEGLDGIEVYNYHGVMKFSKNASDKMNNYIITISKEKDLINTYGSDCHGKQSWGMQLGSFGCSKEVIKPFLEKIKTL